MADTTDVAQQTPKQPAQKSKPRVSTYSRPIFRRNFTLQTLHAQKVFNRSFTKVAEGLFSLDVILQIIANQEEVKQVSLLINELMDKKEAEQKVALEQFKKLFADNGIEGLPEYTNPKTVNVEINSPQLPRYLRLISVMDQIIMAIDTLWLNSVLDSEQRTDAVFEWQQKMIKLSNQIINIERRAKAAAYKQGEAVPAKEEEEITLEADPDNNELSESDLATPTEPTDSAESASTENVDAAEDTKTTVAA